MISILLEDVIVKEYMFNNLLNFHFYMSLISVLLIISLINFYLLNKDINLLKLKVATIEGVLWNPIN